MRGALQRAGAGAASIDVLFSAAGGHMALDEAEASAILDIFGTAQPAVVALKGMVGETLGASGALNLAAGVVSLEQGVLPAFPGADQCAFNGLNVVSETQEEAVRTILVNAGGPDAGPWVSAVLTSA